MTSRPVHSIAILFSAILTLLSTILTSANNLTSEQRINFTYFSVNEGLSHGTIVSCCQDTLGHIWFATNDGLNRYDGYEFHVYRNMENEEKFSVNTETLKEETKETVNQVKESIKNVNLKNDAEETKGFLKEMFSNPFEVVRKVAIEEENVFKKAIIIMLVFIIISAIYSIISVIRFGKYSGILEKQLNKKETAFSNVPMCK